MYSRPFGNFQSDNTSANKGSGDTSNISADQSKNDKKDLELARHIRHKVVKDKSLSVSAHNVKIIAQDGKVTLKGPVNSGDEERLIVDYAKKYAGDGNVTDQMTVKGDGKTN